MTVEALRGGRPEVLDELLERYGRDIDGVAYLILRDRSAAEDVVIETLLTALGHGRDLRDPDALRPLAAAHRRQPCPGHATPRGARGAPPRRSGDRRQWRARRAPIDTSGRWTGPVSSPPGRASTLSSRALPIGRFEAPNRYAVVSSLDGPKGLSVGLSGGDRRLALDNGDGRTSLVATDGGQRLDVVGAFAGWEAASGYPAIAP
jgi:hypothetical protein